MLFNDGARLPEYCMKRSRPQSSARTKRRPTASSPRSGKTSRIIVVPESGKKTKRPLFSDDRCGLLFSMTTDGIILADKAGRCLDANASACSLLGFSHKDLTSRSVVDIIAESDAGAFRTFWKKFLKDGSMSGEFSVRTKSGNERFVEIRPVANVSDGVHVVTLRDLTEQKNALIAAQQNEQRYKAFIRNSSEGIWCFALKRPVDITLPVKTQINRFFDDAYLLECNDEYARMYGFSGANEIIGTRLADILVKDDPKNIQYLKDFIRSNYQLREVETVDQDKNGRLFSVVNNFIGTIVDGKLINAWGTQRDVTEKRQQEEELRNSKDSYEELVQKIPFVIYKWRRRANGERLLEYVSPQIKELVGIPAENFLKEQSLFVSMIHPEDRQMFVERNREYDEDPSSFIYECRTTFNGRERWVQFNSTPRIVENGDVVWDGILQDITERKRAEEAIRVSGEENRILAETANALAGLTTEDSVFSYIASTMERIIPNSIIVLSALRQDGQTVVVRNISGLSGLLGKTARSILGFDPLKLEFALDPTLREKHSDPHLHRYENGIYQVAPAVLSKKVASKIQSLLQFQDVYSIGITGSSVHGFLHLFCYDDHSKENLGVIEPFVHLCTMSLEKIRTFTEIKESERRYRLLADNAADVVWVMNFDGTFIYISPSITALRGFTVEELMDLPVDRHICASSLQTIRPLMEKAKNVLAGIEVDLSPDIFEIEQPCKDGSTIWVEVNATVVFDDHRKPYGVLGVSHNITKRKRAEEDLRQRNTENRFLAEASMALAECSSEKEVFSIIDSKLRGLIPGAVVFIMKTTDDGQKSIVVDIGGIDRSVLSAGMKLLRYDPIGKEFDNMKGFAELFCKPKLHNFPGGLYEVSTGVLPKFLAGKIEKLLGVKGFYSIGIAEENSYLGYIHLFTKQERLPVFPSTIETFVHQCHLALTKIASQTQMADEAHRRMTMMNTSGDGIAIINQQHRVIECNPRFARMLGYSVNELVGMHTWDFEARMSESEIQKHFSDLSAVNTIFETQHRRKDGSVYDVEVNASGTSIGGQAMIFVVCRDITERKEMISALRDSEEKHRTLFDTMAQGVVYQDRNGKIISANPAAERLLGLTLDQLLGRTSTDPEWHCIREDGTPFPGEEHPAMVSLRTGTKVLGTMMGVFNPRTRSYSWILIDSAPQFRHGESTPFIVYTTFEDMTERKQIEEERKARLEQIKESEESYRGLFNSVQDAIYIQNEAGEFLDVNDGAVAMYGYTREELLGKTPAFVSAPEKNDHFNFPEIVAEVMNGIPRQFEFWGKRKNGEVFPKSVALYRGVYFGKPVVIALAQDITIRKKQESEIHQKNSRLLSLIHSQTNYVVRTDITGRYTFVNDRFCRTFGFTPEELIGRPSSISYLAEDDDLVRATVIRCLENLGKEFAVTIRKKSASGEVVVSDWEFIALTDHNGDPAEIQCVGHDVTRRLSLEQERERQFGELGLLFTLTQSATRDIDLAQIFDLAVTNLVKGLGCDKSSLSLFDSSGIMQLYAWSGLSDRYRISAAGMSPWSIDAVDPEPVFIENVDDAPLLTALRPVVRDEGIRSLGFIPLNHNGQIIGTLMIFYADHHEFTKQEAQLGQTIALIIAGAIVRKQHSLALKENEQKLRNIFNSMEEGLALNELVFDEQGSVVDYRIIEVNPAFERIANLKRNEVVGRLATDLYQMPAEYISAFWNEHLHASDSIKTDLYNAQTKSWKHVSTSVPVHGKFVTSFFDITERKNTEENLRKSEQYNRTLIDTSPNSMTVTDLNGNLLYANKHALSMYGVAPESAYVGRNIREWVPEQNHGDVAVKLSSVLRGEEVRNYHVTLSREDGSLFFAEVNASLVTDGDGHPINFLIISSDITARTIAEQQVLEARMRLERAEDVARFGNWELSLKDRIFHASDGAKKLYGIFDDEIPLSVVQGSALVEYRSAMDRALIDLIERDIPYSLEFKIRRRSDGEIIDIFSRAEYQRESGKLFGIIQDITERKKAQDHLEKSEQRYRAIVENLHQAYYESDMHAVFTYCNPGFIIMSGYSEKELKQKVSFKMVAPEHRRRVIDAYVSMMAEHRTALTIEFSIITKDNRSFWIEQTSYFDFDTSGRFIKAFHFVKDISERIQSHARLMESEQRYRQITEAVTDYIYTVSIDGDAVAATKHGPGCTAVTGYTQEDFERDTFLWYNMVVPEHRQALEDQLKRLFTESKTEPIEHRIIRKDGAVRWVRNTLVSRRNDAGKIVSYDGLIQDITERKVAELKLRSSEERNRALVSTLPDILFVHDADGRILDYHTPESAVEIVPFEFLIGKRLEDVLSLLGGTSENIPPILLVDESTGKYYRESLELFLAGVLKPKMASAIRTGEMQRYEYCLDSGDGGRFFEARLISFHDDKILNIIRDVTDRVKAVTALRTMNDELEVRVVQRTSQLTEANKELEAFSYSVSHDLRAPLRAIDSFSALLLEGNEEKFDDEGKRLITIIRSSIRKMDLLINGLLTLSRIGRSELHITEIDMNSLAKVLVDENLPEAERDRYTVRCDDLPSVRGDESLIRQALNNLLSNAVKYSAGKDLPVIEISGVVREDSAVFSVKDNGAGFDSERSAKLFGIFQRLHTDDQFKGLGVGLSIVQRIIHRHGGRVWAEGTLNAGATFFFSLPYGTK